VPATTVDRSIRNAISYSSVVEMKPDLGIRTRKMINMQSVAVECNLRTFDKTSIT